MTTKKPATTKSTAKAGGKAKQPAKTAPKAPTKAGVKDPAPKKPATPKAKKPQAKRERPESRTVEPVKPEASPPTDVMILEALNDGLSMSEIAFVDTYLTCYNGMKAWMEIHPDCSRLSAQAQSSKCLSKLKIKNYLAKRAKAAYERTDESQDRLILMYMYQAYGDVNELVEYRRDSCRYCHGTDHLYQRTPNEMKRAQEQHEADKDNAYREAKREGQLDTFHFDDFDPLGGIGYDPRLDPHEDCPECFGEGIGREFFKDTRKAGPAAQAMYAGLKSTKDGLEIKTTSREKAAEMLAKLLKLTDDATNVNLVFDSVDLNARFGDKMTAAHNRMKEIMEKRGLTPKDDA